LQYVHMSRVSETTGHNYALGLSQVNMQLT
jgi:hypothetical protein